MLERLGDSTRYAEDADCEKPMHVQFSRLYSNTTRHWLNNECASANMREMLSLVIVSFYSLYEDYVLDMRLDSAEHTRVCHWSIYLDIAARRNHSQSLFWRSILLWFGIRAHSRFDLAEAIFRAHEAFRLHHGVAPDMAEFKRTMFGRSSDHAFRRAFLDYIAADGSSGIGRASALAVINVLSFVWLPAFQLWRRQAWNEAMDALQNGRKVARHPITATRRYPATPHA